MNTLSRPDRPLPLWVQGLISSPPRAGTGLHQWLFRAACVLKRWREDSEIIGILLAATRDCERDLTREIADAVRNARFVGYSARLSPGLRLMMPRLLTASGIRSPLWPAPDWESIARIAASGAGLADLWDASPVRLEGATPQMSSLPLYSRVIRSCVSPRRILPMLEPFRFLIGGFGTAALGLTPLWCLLP